MALILEGLPGVLTAGQTFEDQRHQRDLHRVAHPRQRVGIADAGDHGGVDAKLFEAPDAGQGLVDAHRIGRVGAPDQEEVLAAAGVQRRLQLHGHFVQGDHRGRPAEHRREGQVLQRQGADAHVLEGADGAGDRLGVAEAVLAIDHHRQAGGLDDPAHGVTIFAEALQAQVGQGELRGAEGRAADAIGLEAGLLDHASAEGVVGARHHQGPRRLQQGSKWRHGDPPSIDKLGRAALDQPAPRGQDLPKSDGGSP